MPIVIGAGGTGGGSGLTLGPPINEFTGNSQNNAQNQRNTYGTNNPSWLAQYDAEPTFVIIISWPNTPTNTLYQARRGGAWADVSGLVRGAPGGDGTRRRRRCAGPF